MVTIPVWGYAVGAVIALAAVGWGLWSNKQSKKDDK